MTTKGQRVSEEIEDKSSRMPGSTTITVTKGGVEGKHGGRKRQMLGMLARRVLGGESAIVGIKYAF